MSDASFERRRFHRVAFDAPTLITQGQQQWETVLRDVSLKGLLAATPAQWQPDPTQNFIVHIILDAHTQVSFEATLTRNSKDLLAFSCLHIDLDSISHLRRLVELNLGDMDLLERELATLIDQH